jgi:hypothetical protein
MRFVKFMRRLSTAALFAVVILAQAAAAADAPAAHRYLYVATPGIRDYLEYGGHGLVVFDVDAGHRFVRRIPTAGLSEKGKPLNVKGICGCAETGRIYISTTRQLMCLDLATDKILWERTYPAGCDRMSITPDGKTIYLPSLEGPLWYVVDAASGEVLHEITRNSGAHNTICGLSGKHAYLAGLKSPLLSVVDTSDQSVRTVGPFSASVRPFTVNGRETRVYVNVNELLGFEVGDLESGKRLYGVEVAGFRQGPIKRHGCPSHGIGLTPDEKEIWVADAHNQRVHVFDNTQSPPKQLESIKLRDEPGWITFSLDGTYAWPSTGDVIDVESRRIITHLTDEEKRPVQSEKMLEVHVQDGKVVRLGNQFGLGRATAP